jgi:riboflavin biosynthesis pyrimidine reductase/predicted DsbA family dithiol-disulfide isomerase
MAFRVPVAHDVVCPWCWIGLFQAKRLKEEFGAEIEWLGYELWPEELGWPEPKASTVPADRPPVPSRFDLMQAAEGIHVPKIARPARMRTHNVHEAIEHVKATGGDTDRFVEAVYRAYWERGETVDDVEVLVRLAHGLADPNELREAIAERRYRDKIVGFDEPAHATGVYNVPTFFLHGERYAEQPYSVLAEAAGPYARLAFPRSPRNRPYTFINMVTTIDGKILSGTVENGEAELGSRVDRAAMRRIEAHADAILVGATTLRHTSPKWVPSTKHRIVLSRSGEVDPAHGFFQGGEAWIAGTEKAGLKTLKSVEPVRLLSELRDLGIERLLILGGSEINAHFLAADVVDELFWTVAPSVKLGREIPTYAGGEPLESPRPFRLLESRQFGSELFLRYRRAR